MALIPINDTRRVVRRKEPTVFHYGYRKQSVHNLSQYWAFLVIFVIMYLAHLTKNELMRLPTPMDKKDHQNDPNLFISERAFEDLRMITNIGPRVSGTYENEVLAVDYFKKEISSIQQVAHKNHKIYADVQNATGSYWAAFKVNPMTNVYRNIQNVIVKLAGETDKHALLLNCHFDSVPGSPGSSDDAASCTVMLEILRVLSNLPTRTKHSIVFLFNGAEELVLQGSHAFITQHPWAKNIRAFINLESVGSSGKEILFQSGPNNPWLIDMYKKAVPNPNGQVIGEELFQSGIIPSDTDFRIFRDFGKIVGLDMAHFMNGYRYHTSYDHTDYLSVRVLQHTGDNALELTKLMANSNILANVKRHSSGEKVYFDVNGLFFLSYSKNMGIFLNLLVAALSIIIPYYNLRRTTTNINSTQIRKEIFFGLVNTISAGILAFVCIFGISYELDSSGNSMVWYHHTIFATIMYCMPTFLIYCFVQRTFLYRLDSPLSLGLIVQARLCGINILWSILSFVITVAGYRSAYIFMLPSAVTITTNLIIGITGIQNTIKKWLYVHLIGQLLIIVWTTHLFHLTLALFIPIAGRSGGGPDSQNPDLVIGIICWAFTIYITSYLTPLISLLNKSKLFLYSLIILFVLTRWGCLTLTGTGFPYRDHRQGHNPTPQRHEITHTIRTVYDQNGEVTYTDSGFYFKVMDRNAIKTIESLMAPDLPIPQKENPLCDKIPFCGLPVFSTRQLRIDGYWVEAPAPKIADEAKLISLENNKINKNERELKFTLTGNFLMSLQIRPKVGVNLTNWNLLDHVPEPNFYNNEYAYFVKMTPGLNAAPINVTLNFQFGTNNYDGPLADISLVTLRYEDYHEYVSTFAVLLAKMPEWVFTVSASGSVQSFTF